jgi:O-antigen biosynthesis protein WbqV
MGEPVRIMDLAEKMIRLSGKEPGHDVAIRIIGARPGEKLHEELVGADETVAGSPHPGINRVTRPPIDGLWLDEELAALRSLVEAGETLELVGMLTRIVREPRRATAPQPVRR